MDAEARRASNRVHAKRYRDENPDKVRETKRRHRQGARRRVIEHYGGVCACCGEAEFAFLALDHINNDGAEHRRAHNLRSGDDIVKWLLRHGLPDGLVQVLCHNCNVGKKINGGRCPHVARALEGASY